MILVVQTCDDGLEIATSGPVEAQALAQALESQIEVEDIVPAISTVAVRARPDRIAEIKTRIESFSLTDLPLEHTPRRVELAVQYGGEFGPDLAHASAQISLSESELIAMHTGGDYRVDMMGFTPGFAYLSGGSGISGIPRLTHPKPRVTAGSVGVCGARTGLYALDGPGGWPIIGRTIDKLFEAEASAPFLLQPGDTVRFRAI